MIKKFLLTFPIALSSTFAFSSITVDNLMPEALAQYNYNDDKVNFYDKEYDGEVVEFFNGKFAVTDSLSETYEFIDKQEYLSDLRKDLFKMYANGVNFIIQNAEKENIIDSYAKFSTNINACAFVGYSKEKEFVINGILSRMVSDKNDTLRLLPTAKKLYELELEMDISDDEAAEMLMTCSQFAKDNSI